MRTEEPLLEILLRPRMGEPSGLRVYLDGRYRSMDGDNPWKDVWVYTDAEMAELQQAIRHANPDELKAEYSPENPVADGTHINWKITLDGQTYQIHLAPGASVPVLDTLYHAFSTLRKMSPEHSDWRVWQPGGTYHEFRVLGSVNAVDALRPLIAALFTPQVSSIPVFEGIPGDTLLVKTIWTSEGASEVTEYFAGGRYLRQKDGERVEESMLSSERMSAIMGAIAATDWSAVPELIDAT